MAGSQEALQILRAKGYTGPADVIPQFGVDVDRFIPGAVHDGPFTVGFLGRLVPEKGIDDLLAAFQTLEAPARLVIAGDGPLAGHVDKATARWRDEGRCERFPRVPSEEIPALLRRLNAVGLPSRTTARWREQYGRILIEAMASGVAVIGTDSGEIPNVIGEAGIIVPEGDPVTLAGALKDLARSPQLRQQLAAMGGSVRSLTFPNEQLPSARTRFTKASWVKQAKAVCAFSLSLQSPNALNCRA